MAKYFEVCEAPTGMFTWEFRDEEDHPLAVSPAAFNSERGAKDNAMQFIDSFNSGQRYFAVIVPSDKDAEE